MSRGGHNWKGGGTVESARSLDVMRLARDGFLSRPCSGTVRWNQGDGTTATIQFIGGRDAITLDYRVQLGGSDWQTVKQRIPIQWTPCRFGGERAWFICAVHANDVYCGRRVAKLHGAGKLFACRQCYRLGYRAQRGDRMDQADHNLRRLHRKLSSEYVGPHQPPPPKPKWMRWRTYDRLADQIEAGQERLDTIFSTGAMRIYTRIHKSEQRGRTRR